MDYDGKRGVNKNHIQRIADGKCIIKKENILITDPTGTGKIFLASALGQQACQQGFKLLYANATRLFTQLKMTKADGSAFRDLAKIESPDQLILDDFGIQPIEQISRSSILEIIKARHGKSSTIITSQVPIKPKYEVIGEKQWLTPSRIKS